MCRVRNYLRLVQEATKLLGLIPFSARDFFTRHICEIRECYPEDRHQKIFGFFEKSDDKHKKIWYNIFVQSRLFVIRKE